MRQSISEENRPGIFRTSDQIGGGPTVSSRWVELDWNLDAGDRSPCPGRAGSTLIACERTGRHARVLEIVPGYVDAIIRRWQGITGRSATLEGDGRSFEDVVAGQLPKVRDADERAGAVVMDSQLEPDVALLPKPWLRWTAKAGKAGATESAKACAAFQIYYLASPNLRSLRQVALQLNRSETLMELLRYVPTKGICWALDFQR